MPRTTITGDESIAYGALLAGVRVAAGYPGSPSSSTIQALAGYMDTHPLHVEWSTNEKVAFETTVGASIGGAPALMGCKGVGFNVALDPIMVANLLDTGAGLVILLGDDPGAWSSQNDQDTRPIAAGAELPILEPATPREGIDMTRAAFDLSRERQLPVIIRITKSFGAMTQEMDTPELPVAEPVARHPFPREAMRWISAPTNAVSLHRRLHDRLKEIAAAFETSRFNTVTGEGDRGIIASGFTYTKLMDVLDGADKTGLRILKLGTTAPLPSRLILDFLRKTDTALILEENEPFLETHIKAMAYDAGLRTPIYGKGTGAVPREGELFLWQIADALKRYMPGFEPARTFTPEDEKKYMPSLAGIPENCPYSPVFEIIRDESKKLDINPVFVVDPGCAIKINTPPFEMLDIKYSMGSSIGIASGLVWAGVSDPVIAVVGDSDFFHLGANALFNVVHQGGDMLILILDNATTALSGFQPSPNLSDGVSERGTTALSIEGIIEACPVAMLRTIDPWDEHTARDTLHTGLTAKGIRVIVSRSPCPYIETKFCPGYQAKTAQANYENGL